MSRTALSFPNEAAPEIIQGHSDEAEENTTDKTFFLFLLGEGEHII